MWLGDGQSNELETSEVVIANEVQVTEVVLDTVATVTGTDGN